MTRLFCQSGPTVVIGPIQVSGGGIEPDEIVGESGESTRLQIHERTLEPRALPRSAIPDRFSAVLVSLIVYISAARPCLAAARDRNPARQGIQLNPWWERMAGIVLENLAKTFAVAGSEPVRAVRDLSLTIADGEFLVLAGPSGSGKSTLLRLIAGLETVTGGTIRIGGRAVNAVPPQERDVAMLFQNHALYPHLTARGNLELGSKIRKVPTAEMHRRLKETAELLGLSALLNRMPKELSGGERQRVALGRAMMRQPRLFLMDEPLSNLDAPLRTQMRRELCALQKRLGATFLYVTHDQVEAMTMAQRIAVIQGGQLQQVGDPMAIYQRPANCFVGGFFGAPSMNFFRGQVQRTERGLRFWGARGGRAGDGLELALGTTVPAPLAAYTDKPILLGIRPEDIYCGAASRPATASPAEEHRLEFIENLGAETLLHFSCGDHRFVARHQAGSGLELERSWPLFFDLGRACWFDPATDRAIW